MPARVPLTVLVLTFNEELNLGDCLASVASWAESLVIVDSGSTDRTIDIARKYGAHLLTHPFDTHARQWRWALDHLADVPSSAGHEWVLGLDSDQRVTHELADEIRRRLASDADSSVTDTIDGFYVNRRHIFRGPMDSRTEAAIRSTSLSSFAATRYSSTTTTWWIITSTSRGRFTSCGTI